MDNLIAYTLAGNATPFAEVARVYAPKYRQAALYAFLSPGDDGHAALDVAYEDVLAAFDHYLAHDNGGRPILLAGHSQGTGHAIRLVEDRIAGTPLQDQLVAAYLIGYRFPMDKFERTLGTIGPCDSADQIGCVVAWDTVAEGGTTEPAAGHWYPGGWEYDHDKEILCTNPLSWRVGGSGMPAEAHQGGVPLDLDLFWSRMRKRDPALVPPDPLPAVQPTRISAECRDGALWVSDPGDARYKRVQDSYHAADFTLFWMDLRNNSSARVEAWGHRRAAAAPSAER